MPCARPRTRRRLAFHCGVCRYPWYHRCHSACLRACSSSLFACSLRHSSCLFSLSFSYSAHLRLLFTDLRHLLQMALSVAFDSSTCRPPMICTLSPHSELCPSSIRCTRPGPYSCGAACQKT